MILIKKDTQLSYEEKNKKRKIDPKRNNNWISLQKKIKIYENPKKIS